MAYHDTNQRNATALVGAGQSISRTVSVPPPDEHEREIPAMLSRLARAISMLDEQAEELTKSLELVLQPAAPAEPVAGSGHPPATTQMGVTISDQIMRVSRIANHLGGLRARLEV